SATKSFTSALVGVAIGHGLLKGPDQTVSETLPQSLFTNQQAFERFQKVTLKDVLGMSALDAPVFPHLDTPAAKRRLANWWKADNRVNFALSQRLLSSPGHDFQYTAVTCSLAAGAVEYSSGMTMLDLANKTLFRPMGFRNQEWMHEDRSGIDN